MLFRVEFNEDGKLFHTFIHAANGADAAETVTCAFESLKREITITDFRPSSEPPRKPSEKLNLIDRDVKSSTSVWNDT